MSRTNVLLAATGRSRAAHAAATVLNDDELIAIENLPLSPA